MAETERGRMVNELSVQEVVVHSNPHPSRSERRHVRPFRFRNGQRVDYKVFVPTRFQDQARNEPYRADR